MEENTIEKKSTKKSKIIWIIVLVLIVLAALLLPNFAAIKEQSRRVNNLSHLNAIYKSLSESSLSPNFQSLGNIDPKADYVLVTNHLAGNHQDGNNVLIFSKPECFPGKGGNVIFVAGQGKWCDLEEYNRLTKGLIPTAP